MSFTYVDVVGTGCEGWLNLFFNGKCIALVNNKYTADQIRSEINKKTAIDNEIKVAIIGSGLNIDTTHLIRALELIDIQNKNTFNLEPSWQELNKGKLSKKNRRAL